MFAAIAFVLKHLTLIVATVQLVENLTNGTGAEKKAAAMKLLETGLPKLGITVTPRTRQVVGHLVDFVVHVLNDFGFFKSTEGSDPELVEIATEDARAQHVPVNETDDEFERLERLLRGEKE